MGKVRRTDEISVLPVELRLKANNVDKTVIRSGRSLHLQSIWRVNQPVHLEPSRPLPTPLGDLSILTP
jgi:hypothetical protein